MRPRRCLIAGCGDVGLRLGRLLAAQGAEVWGLRRSGTLPTPLQTIHADLTKPLSGLALPADLDALIYLPTPDARTEQAYQALYVDGLLALLDQFGPLPDRVVLVTSTAVYGDNADAWVDEATPAAPAQFNGRILLQAESLLRQRVADAIVMRFAGLYGPGRHALIERVRRGIPCQAKPPLWTNRIHVDDAARALLHVLNLDAPATLYVGVDDEPATECEVTQWLAAQLGLPPTPTVSVASRGGGKRLRNSRLRESGFVFDYPSFRDGYAALIAAGGNGTGDNSG